MSAAKRLVVWGAVCLAACSGNNPYRNPEGGIQSETVPFQALAPRVYVNKVKTLLISDAASDAEVSRIETTPAAMADLVAEWQNSPAYQEKMLAFLSKSFQQSQVDGFAFADQGVEIRGTNSDMLVQNLRESFARTVLDMEARGEPFNTAMSLRSFMMTPAVADYYAFVDGVQINDAGQRSGSNGDDFTNRLQGMAAADFTTWRRVSIRRPNAGEATTTPDAARTANELVLTRPRQGFFSTPSFFAQWQTNKNNKARVTMNQTVLVALGKPFDGKGSVVPASTAAIDTAHAQPNSVCFGCHYNLDPMRQFFRQAYTLHYSAQTDPNMMSLPGQFAFAGVSAPGDSGLYALGDNLAAHPNVAAAWVQKVCTYANDMPCIEDDPEFQRIVDVFRRRFSFNELVREVFASPLTTYSAKTMTASKLGQSFPVAKRDHLCPLLSQRLKMPDLCGLDATVAAPQGDMRRVQTIAKLLPGNGYSRGSATPVLANDPTLFYRASLENICTYVSAKLVDAGSTPMFSSKDVDAAIGTMVHDLMGVRAPEDGEPAAILREHYDAAMATGVKAVDALKSTFISACMSPAVAGIGQ